jgi:hypothetical protein
MNNPLPVQPMPSTSRSKRWLRKLLPALSMLALVLLFGVIVAIFLALDVQLETQLDTVRVLKPWGIAIQGALIVLIGLGWTQVVNWGRRRGIVQEWEYEQALAARGKGLLMMLAYWLLIPVGPATLLRVLGG